MTIYNKLISMGHTDEDIRAEEAWDLGPRRFSVVVQDTPDGPLVGIAYQSDYRFEEEDGVTKIIEALTGKDRWRPFILSGRQAHFGQFRELPGSSLVLSTVPMEKPLVWGETIQEEGKLSDWTAVEHANPGSGESRHDWDYYDTWWENSMPYTQDLESAKPLYEKTHTLAWLTERAKELGIEKPAKTKAPLVEQIREVETANRPNVWPGWFHRGHALILRADRGVTADVLNLLHVAALNESLGFGGGGFRVFASGLSLYDGSDIGPLYAEELRKRRVQTLRVEKGKPAEPWYLRLLNRFRPGR